MIKRPLKIMLLIGTARAYGRNLLHGIARYARLHGPWEIYRIPPFYRDPYGKDTALAQIRNWGADGLILRENQGFKDRIPQGIPTVISSESEEYIPGCGHIVGDHEAIGRMGAQHLMDLGFKNLAYCGFEDIYWSRMRCRGFCEAAEKAKRTVHVYHEPPMSPSLLWEMEQPYLAQWIETLPTGTGLMACADERSEQVLQACKTVGRRVPDDIAMIGADNDELICDLSYPTLSSIAFNTQQVGFEAALLLDRMITGNPPEEERKVILKPTHVQARQSTDIMKVDDAIVAQALRFIRDNSHHQMTVDSVIQETLVSRRALERRFQKTLGTSVFKQIVKERLAKTEQLLLETHLSVAQIAKKLNFTNHQQIDRYFRQNRGIAPLEFRRQARQSPHK